MKTTVFFLGEEKRRPSFTPIVKRLWPYWERFFTLSIAWESVTAYPDGRAQLTVSVPRVIGTWIVSAFSINQQTGLTVLPNFLMVNRELSSFVVVSLYICVVRRYKTIFYCRRNTNNRSTWRTNWRSC